MYVYVYEIRKEMNDYERKKKWCKGKNKYYARGEEFSQIKVFNLNLNCIEKGTEKENAEMQNCK